jgi:3-oxoacyl-[acyl-carrier-protein] synthase III
MNLVFEPRASVRLLSTAVASPMDLEPRGERGIELSSDAIHERVLGASWREHATARPSASRALRQWVRGADAGDLGTLAAERALRSAGLRAADLAAVIVATSTPPRISASLSARIGRSLGCADTLSNASCLDVRAGGVGGLLAFLTAQGLLAMGAGPVLVVATEAASPFFAPLDVASALLYADGAGACILATAKGSGDAFLGGASGQMAVGGRPTTIPGDLPPTDEPGASLRYRFQKPDRAHLEHLGRLWDAFPRELAARFPEAAERVTHFVPYAVSDRQVDAALHAFGNPRARAYHELEARGCLGTASVLVALHGLLESGRARPGDVVALAAAAGNGSWAGFFWCVGEATP